MEEKESTFSGSPENTDSGSPTPISGMGPMGVGVGPETHMISSAPQAVAPSDSAAVHGGASGGGIPTTGKKRGRPRKYDAEGNLNPAYAAAAARKAAAAAVSPPPGFTLTMAPSEYAPKRGRGRPPSSNSPHQHQHHHHQQPQQPSLGGEVFANTAGGDFTPHIITVQTGEDVQAKIFSFNQKGPQAICILSANGTISNVTIRQPGSSGLLTYEGRFEILSLTGSYTCIEAGGVKSRTGGLSISLAGPDGRVVGGSVAGWITAASPVQVVVGSFTLHGYKTPKRKYHRESPTAAAIPTIPETGTAPTPNTQAMHDNEVGGAPAMPLMATQSHSEADDSIGSGHNLNVVSSHDTLEWNNGSDPSSDHRVYPDINVSLPGV